jgi:hypothetical protein
MKNATTQTRNKEKYLVALRLAVFARYSNRLIVEDKFNFSVGTTAVSESVVAFTAVCVSSFILEPLFDAIQDRNASEFAELSEGKSTKFCPCDRWAKSTHAGMRCCPQTAKNWVSARFERTLFSG